MVMWVTKEDGCFVLDGGLEPPTERETAGCGEVAHGFFWLLLRHSRLLSCYIITTIAVKVCMCRWTVVRRDRANWRSDFTRLHHWLGSRWGHHSNVDSQRQGLLTSSITFTSNNAADVQLPKKTVPSHSPSSVTIVAFWHLRIWTLEGGVLTFVGYSGRLKHGSWAYSSLSFYLINPHEPWT